MHTSLSLRHEFANQNGVAVTKYDVLGKQLKRDIDDLNARHALGTSRRSAVSSCGTFKGDSKGSTREFKCTYPVLDFVCNGSGCLPPPGAKGARSGNLPRYGAFEVVVAVYRGHEKQWHEFLVYSKLGSGRFPNINFLRARLDSLLSRSAGQTEASILIQAQVNVSRVIWLDDGDLGVIV